MAFGAMGTAGQRCTTLRRLFVHDSIYETFVPRLAAVYAGVAVGDPRDDGNLVGPLIDGQAFAGMASAHDAARAAEGRVHGGERVEVHGPDAFYARPALVEMNEQLECVRQETFAPILYVFRYSELDAAIALQNDVPQGLSSSIFAADIRGIEHFLSVAGSDCGIANVNMGTSGAEIGGAFGGEKETGGRARKRLGQLESLYMRRQTGAINYGRSLPPAQGVTFDI